MQERVCVNEVRNRPVTPWGLKVKVALLQSGKNQQWLVEELQARGYKVSKQVLTNLIRGVTLSARRDVVEEINCILEIK